MTGRCADCTTATERTRCRACLRATVADLRARIRAARAELAQVGPGERYAMTDYCARRIGGAEEHLATPRRKVAKGR